jgi:hypothetical protein
MMVKRAAEIEDRRIVAKRLFDALCAAYSDKYITLIQPREPDAPLPARVTLPPSRGSVFERLWRHRRVANPYS